MNNHFPTPPKWCVDFLHWYCKDNLIEEIHGDALELFQIRVEEEGLVSARRKYVWDVLRFFRWSNLKQNKISNSLINTTMLLNYFKIGFRSINKHKVPSILNIIGLAVAIACSLVFFIYVDWNLNLDGFHKDKDNTFQIISYIPKNNNMEKWGSSPLPLGPALKNGHSAIESALRMDYSSATVKTDRDIFNDPVVFVDDNLFSFFSFDILYGAKSALSDPNSIVITDKAAVKYFGSEMPIGKQLTLIFNESKKEVYNIGAVIHFPNNSSFPLHIILPFQLREKIYEDRPSSDWGLFTDATFVKLKNQSNKTAVEEILAGYLEGQNEVNIERPISSFALQQLTTLSQNAYSIKGSIASGQQPVGYLAIGVIIVFLLLLAATNYLNIAISAASTRLKEIGLRKVIGGSRRELVAQFVIENFILCSLSIIVGFGIAYFFFWPAFLTITPSEIPFQFSGIQTTLLSIGGLLLFVVLVSGLYPAIYISSFQAVDIFSGKSKFGSKSKFSKILLSFQFLLAFMLVVLGIRFTENKIFFQNKDWGYNQKSLLVMPVDNESQYNALANELKQHGDIESIAGSKSIVGNFQWSTQTVAIDGEDKRIRTFDVLPEYPSILELQLKEGRFFKEGANADKNSVIINESLAVMQDWVQPIGQSIVLDSSIYYVSGVVKDFHYLDFYEKIEPVIFRVTETENIKFLTARINEKGSLSEAEDLLNSKWKELEPDLPKKAFHQSELFGNFFESMGNDTGMMLFISAIAIFLASMGLFGTVSYNIAKRMKEFSIKRVLGATTKTIYLNLNQDIKWIFIVALLVGVPVSYYLTNALINVIFPVYKPFSAVPFGIGIAIIALITLVSVTFQINKVLKKNPTEVLRNE